MKLNKGEAIVRANAKSVVLLTVCASVLACAAGLGCLQGCSPQEAASQGAAPKAEAANGSITLTEWTTETDCSTCHADEASSRQDAACTASKHTSLQCAGHHRQPARAAGNRHARPDRLHRLPQHARGADRSARGRQSVLHELPPCRRVRMLHLP